MEMAESIENFCKPTSSQEGKFPNCPLARESENFLESNYENFPSSPDFKPSETTGIVVLSLPDSPCPIEQHMADEGAVFVTPPEHHCNSQLSSSVDQNANDLLAEHLTVAEAKEETEARASEVRLDDEPEEDRLTVERGEEFDGDTVPLGEPEDIVVGSGDSGVEEIRANSNLDAAGEAGSVSIVREVGGLLSSGEAINGNHEPGQNMEGIDCGGEEIEDTSNSDGAGEAGSVSIVREIGVLLSSGDDINGNHELGQNKEDIVMSPKEAKKPKESDTSGGSGKRIEEIDEFRYVVDGVGCSSRKKKKEKMKEKIVVESSEEKSELFELLDRFMTTTKDVGRDRDSDFMATAKRKGVVIPRPRWWPSEGDEDMELFL